MERCSTFSLFEATVEVASKFVKEGQYFKILSGARCGGPAFSIYIDPQGEVYLSSLWGNAYFNINRPFKKRVIGFILYSRRWKGSKELVSLSEVGCNPDPIGRYVHPNGWCSSHPWGWKIDPSPKWGGGESPLRIKEGIIIPSDEGVQIIPPREYYR